MKRETPDRRMAVCFALTMVFSSAYLIWRIFFTIPWDAGFWQAAAGVLLAAAETVTTLGMFELMIGRLRRRHSELTPPEAPPEDFPDVDVFVATHNESTDLLYKTLNACTFLDYPDRGRVHVFVCDDGNRAEVAALAARLGVAYLGCADNEHAKSGNYNNALAHTSSPLVATFDADMIPRREFLVRTVPYFLIPDVKMGLVQTPQSFYNSDLFQFNLYSEKDIPNEQDFFSREINVLRNASNSAAYTGSNTVLSRAALEEIGGFPTGTITEDFETSVRMQKAGYLTYATTEVLAAGLSATTVQSMIGQRVRWARGVIQSIRNTNAVFTRKLPLAANLSYLNAYLYWWSFFCRMIFILAPIAFALFGFQLVDCGFWELLAFWLPSHLCYSLSVRYLSTNIRNLRWSQVIDTILAPYLIVPVFLESLGIRQTKFQVTDKRKAAGRTASGRYLVAHGALIALTLAAAARYANGKYGMALVYSGVILFWLLYNLTTLVYAVFFMLGRESKRRSERIRAEEAALVEVNGNTFEGVTQDVSEEGVALHLGGEPGAQGGDALRVTVTTQRYRAALRGRAVYVHEEPGGWFCAATVRPESERDKRQWLQIIHDRAHSLPVEIDPWMTTFDELTRNLLLRVRQWLRG